MNTLDATQMLKTPTKSANCSITTCSDVHSKQLSQANLDTVNQTAQMLSIVQKFSKEMGLDLLIAIRDKQNDGVLTISTDPGSFSLKEAAKTKLVRKISMDDEKESVKAISSLLSDKKQHLLDSAMTISSSLSETTLTKTINNNATLHANCQKDVKMGKLAQEVNFASLMSFDDDDDEIMDRVSRSPLIEADQRSDHLAEPRLRRFITEAGKEELQISKISSGDSPSSEGQKFLAHTRTSKPEHFCNRHLRQGRNLFAQKHLFKSGLQGEQQPEVFDSDEEASFEADLTDPVSRDYSNVESAKSAIEDSQSQNSQSNYANDDDDQLDFMFLACADWEKIVEDEKAQLDSDSVTSNKAHSATGPRVCEFPANMQLKREVKADLKVQKNSCSSFEAYCKDSSEIEWKEPVAKPSLDIDSMMKKVQPHDRSRKRKHNSKKTHEQSSGVGSKRCHPMKTPQLQGFKRPGQFSSAADLFKRTTKTII